MGTKLLVVLSGILLLGCSEGGMDSGLVPEASKVAPPPIKFVESDETIEKRTIGNEALALLKRREFVQLEALIEKYRASKERHANGLWKLAMAYNGLEVPDSDPETEWQVRFGQINEWIMARPKSVEPRIALARVLTDYAWKARGGGWADTVKESDWDVFHKRLSQALDSLKDARQLGKKCPAYWSSLQLVALGMGIERNQYDAIFTEAIQEFPDYEYYYKARSTYLLPRWHGEEGEWERDATKSADQIGGEEGDVIYALVVWSVNHYGAPGGASAAFKADPSAWKRVDRGFDVILKRFPDSLGAKTERAYLAALAGDRRKAQRYFGETKGEVDLKHWGSKESFEKFLRWTYAQ
jgi:hypothetical protein